MDKMTWTCPNDACAFAQEWRRFNPMKAKVFWLTAGVGTLAAMGMNAGLALGGTAMVATVPAGMVGAIAAFYVNKALLASLTQCERCGTIARWDEAVGEVRLLKTRERAYLASGTKAWEALEASAKLARKGIARLRKKRQ